MKPDCCFLLWPTLEWPQQRQQSASFFAMHEGRQLESFLRHQFRALQTASYILLQTLKRNNCSIPTTIQNVILKCLRFKLKAAARGEKELIVANPKTPGLQALTPSLLITSRISAFGEPCRMNCSRLVPPRFESLAVAPEIRRGYVKGPTSRATVSNRVWC